MKPSLWVKYQIIRKSHPTWVRGLKPGIIYQSATSMTVAPHVGAWIETAFAGLGEAIASVAPHVGAWIETDSIKEMVVFSEVAPHVGAWIETHIMFRSESTRMSHPTWVRGLKLRLVVRVLPLPVVAPHVGAWIETPNSPPLYLPVRRRTPRGCVD